MNRSSKKALIIGCGVAGPVVALFLQKAGIEAELYEARAESTDYGGSFLNMACNGLDVLKALQLDEQVTSQGSPIPRMMIWSGNGKRLGEVRNGARTVVGAPSVNILRSRLHQLLRQGAERQGIKMAFGKKLVGLSTDSQGVVATFADGTTAEGSFLVGCNGVYSRTRQRIHPGAPTPTIYWSDQYGWLRIALQLSPHSGDDAFRLWQAGLLRLSHQFLRGDVLVCQFPTKRSAGEGRLRHDRERGVAGAHARSLLRGPASHLRDDSGDREHDHRLSDL